MAILLCLVVEGAPERIVGREFTRMLDTSSLFALDVPDLLGVIWYITFGLLSVLAPGGLLLPKGTIVGLNLALALLGLDQRKLVVIDGFLEGTAPAKHLVPQHRILLIGELLAHVPLVAHQICIPKNLEGVVAQVGTARLQVVLATRSPK